MEVRTMKKVTMAVVLTLLSMNAVAKGGGGGGHASAGGGHASSSARAEAHFAPRPTPSQKPTQPVWFPYYYAGHGNSCGEAEKKLGKCK